MTMKPMTEAERFEAARGRALTRLTTSGKPFTERDLLTAAREEFDRDEERLRNEGANLQYDG
jgi:hypothetical protein